LLVLGLRYYIYDTVRKRLDGSDECDKTYDTALGPGADDVVIAGLLKDAKDNLFLESLLFRTDFILDIRPFFFSTGAGAPSVTGVLMLTLYCDLGQRS
jgi:hypothetical protein